MSGSILPRPLIALTLLMLAAGGCASESRSTDEREARWRPIAATPLDGRFLPAAVWIGREVLVWGGAECQGACAGQGVRHHADGGAYDASTDTWRLLAPSPLSARAGALAVWTGHELVVWGGMVGDRFLADGAAFDPEQNRWRTLPMSPLAGQFATPPGTVARVPGVWTGTEMLVWGQGAGREGADPELPAGAAYEPATDRWRLLAPAPVAPRIAVPVWTGREMVVWGGQSGRRYFDDGAAYDPIADRWRSLSTSPLAARFTSSVWTGEEVLTWGGESSDEAFDDGAAYDPVGDSWRRLPPSPLNARRGFAQVWTGREMVVWGGAPGAGAGFLATGAALDPHAGRWREIAPRPARLLPLGVSTGHGLVVWGGIESTATGLLGSSSEGGLLCLGASCPRR